MRIEIVDTGFFKLDGGAMFGVVPRQMWNKLNPGDENNMCTWAMRCLYVEDGNRKILIDTGMGDKQDDKFKSHFEPHGPYDLYSSLKAIDIASEEITDVFLTHLHFDHGGGALIKDKAGNIKPAFPNASYWTNQSHLDSALKPNPREKASFLKENIVPLIDGDYFKFLDEVNGVHLTENITVDFYYGHTEAMMVPTIKLESGKKLVYPADLLPSAHHVRMPYVMAYDIKPLVTLKEKAAFYEKIEDAETFLFFEHDKDTAVGQLQRNERGRYSIDTGMGFEALK